MVADVGGPAPLGGSAGAQALILRDYTLLWALSIGFELMELTFQHMLPNFNECWWDSWILDVAVCNFIGIYTGMQARPRPTLANIRAYPTLSPRMKRKGSLNLMRLAFRTSVAPVQRDDISVPPEPCGPTTTTVGSRSVYFPRRRPLPAATPDGSDRHKPSSVVQMRGRRVVTPSRARFHLTTSVSWKAGIEIRVGMADLMSSNHYN